MEKNVNIIIGRFQPFTYGHLKCVEEAKKQLGVPTVMLMIDTPENKVDEKHPFPSSMLIPIYQESLVKTNKLLDIQLVKNADIVKNSELLKGLGYNIVSWTCGTDRIETYSKMIERYRADLPIDPDFKLIEIKRSGRDISATAARKALKEDNLNEWKKMTPLYNLREKLEGNKIYNILRKQILSI